MPEGVRGIAGLRLLLATTAGSAILLLAVSGTARAAVVLDFEPRRAGIGDQVVGTTRGAALNGIESERIVVFLAPSQEAADEASGPEDDRLSRFGLLTADASGVGRFTGSVPSVSPGHYIAVAFCRGCIPGGSIFTVGEFTVLGSALPETGTISMLWPVMAILLAGAGLLIAGATKSG